MSLEDEKDDKARLPSFRNDDRESKGMRSLRKDGERQFV